MCIPLVVKLINLRFKHKILKIIPTSIRFNLELVYNREILEVVIFLSNIDEARSYENINNNKL
jgi:hypothetical protein